MVCVGASPPRGVTSPPANGGNCTIRGATRRRHAEGRLLMLQNPPLPPVSCSLTGAGLTGGRRQTAVGSRRRGPAARAREGWTRVGLARVGRGSTNAGRASPAMTRGSYRRTAPRRGLLPMRRDTPATRRGEASNAAKPPPLPLVSCSLTGAGLPGGRQLTPEGRRWRGPAARARVRRAPIRAGRESPTGPCCTGTGCAGAGRAGRQ